MVEHTMDILLGAYGAALTATTIGGIVYALRSADWRKGVDVMVALAAVLTGVLLCGLIWSVLPPCFSW